MNDEVKKILDGIKLVINHNGSIEFNTQELKKLSVYITNLQQENEKLKKQLNCKEVYSKYMPENIEFIVMGKADYGRQELD